MRFVSTLRSLLLNTDLRSTPKSLDAFAILWSMLGSSLLDDAVTDPQVWRLSNTLYLVVAR